MRKSEYREVLVEALRRYDPSIHRDPLALRIGTGGAPGNGANFVTHRLVEENGRLVYEGTFMRWVFLVPSGVLCVASTVGTIAGCWFNGPGFNADGLLALLGVVLFGFIFYASFGLWRGFLFDKREGTYSRHLFAIERRSPEHPQIRGSLTDVHAILQVPHIQIGKHGAPYFCFEVSLVRRDGIKVPVANHPFTARSRDAEQIAAFLGVPFWDVAMHMPPECLLRERTPG